MWCPLRNHFARLAFPRGSRHILPDSCPRQRTPGEGCVFIRVAVQTVFESLIAMLWSGRLCLAVAFCGVADAVNQRICHGLILVAAAHTGSKIIPRSGFRGVFKVRTAFSVADVERGDHRQNLRSACEPKSVGAAWDANKSTLPPISQPVMARSKSFAIRYTVGFTYLRSVIPISLRVVWTLAWHGMNTITYCAWGLHGVPLCLDRQEGLSVIYIGTLIPPAIVQIRIVDN
jgi:hypothetical protein